MKLFALFLLVLPLASASAQYAEIFERADQTPQWTEKQIIFDSLATLADDDSLPDYRKLVNQVIDRARQENQYDYASDFMIRLAKSYYLEDDHPDTAISIINQAILWKDRLAASSQGNLAFYKAEVFELSDQTDSSLHYYSQAADIFTVLGDSAQALYGRAYIKYAAHLMDRGDFVKASTLLEKARDLLEHRQDSVQLLVTLNMTANLYSMNGLLHKAMTIRDGLIRIADPQNNQSLLLVTYLNYSNEARKLGNDSLEMAMLLKTEDFLDAKDPDIAPYVYVGLCKLVNACARQGLTDQAISYFQQMRALLPDVGESSWLYKFYSRGRADALYSEGRYDESIALAHEIRQDALAKGEMETVMDMERVLDRSHRARGDFKTAYGHLRNYITINDSLTRIDKTNTLLYMETLNEDERKMRLIAKQEGEIQLLAASNLFQSRLAMVGGLALFFLFGALYLYRSNKYARQAKSIQEKYARQLLSSHEEERKRISRDLHDSVGQSLMLIKNKIVLDQDPATVHMVSQALEEVRSISKALHPVLLEKLGLTASIQKLVHDFDENTEILFTEEIDNIDQVFSKEHELQVFRIVQEAINNLVKHAKTPSAEVKVLHKPDKISVLVRDHGVGFDITSQEGHAMGLGMKTLKERTQILGGKLMIDSVKGKGTTLLLEITKKKP